MRITKTFRPRILAGAAIGALSSPVTWASTVWPSDLFATGPGTVLMVDGKERNDRIKLKIRLATSDRAASDVGFTNDGSDVAITRPGHAPGKYTFAGGALAEFTLRNSGADHRFGTADDLRYRLSDSAGYAAEEYFSPIPPLKLRYPVASDSYFHDLRLGWESEPRWRCRCAHVD